MTALWLALAVLQAQGPVDEGTLLVRQDTVEIAREAFRLTPARATPGGWTLATTVRYDRSRPVIVLDPIVELGPDSVGTTLEYTVADPREPMRILGQFTRGRAGRLGVRPLSGHGLAGPGAARAGDRRVPAGRSARAVGGPGSGHRAHDPRPRPRGAAARHGDGRRESAGAHLAGGRRAPRQGRDSVARTGGDAAAGT